MKLVLIVCVLLVVSCSAADEEDVVTSETAEEEQEPEPMIGVQKATEHCRLANVDTLRQASPDYLRPPNADTFRPPNADYLRPPPCPKSYMFSCQPVVKAIGCDQGSYGSAVQPPPPPPQHFRRSPRCSLPQHISFHPVIRTVY